MSLSPKSPPSVWTRRSGLAIFLFSVLVLPAVLTGCGGGQEEDAVLATVGDTEIKASYYEDRLIKLEENELPSAADGSPLDMSLLEGKKGFLETLINKEIMVQAAESMGLHNDPVIVSAREAMTAYEASLVMWDRVIAEPSNTIDPEELEVFYAKMGLSRSCLYVICNFLDDAEAARKKAMDGADWEDIVTEYHDGYNPPNGTYRIVVPFGRYSPEFENVVFNAEIGGITSPIKTSYGYWVLKVLSEKSGKKPPLEEAKAQILDVTWARKRAHLNNEFKKSVIEKFQLTIHEDALWKCYLALPEGETIFRDGTQEPRKKDELRPLDIATEDLDMPFYSYLGRDGIQEYALLDYKVHFDNMSIFQRPKDTEMLGGLRRKIEDEFGNTLLNFEAEDRGLYEDPEVVRKVNFKLEQMLISKLYAEVIQIEELVTPGEEEEFWAAHLQDYVMPENRSGWLVICQDAEQAAEAQAKVAEGMGWKGIMNTYGTDADNKSRSGKLDGVIEQPGDPVSVALFAIQPGELSEPFALADGRYGVVQLESVTPEWARELSEAREAVDHRLRGIRKEEAFQVMIAKWKEDIPVTIHEENLADLASWQELMTVELPGPLVPRN